MGWWSLRKDTKEEYNPRDYTVPLDESELLTIGDEPMDTIITALKKVTRQYKRDLKRKPVPEELTELLQSCIKVLEDDLFDDMEERELDSVTIKLRQRPKRPRPKPGDYFAFPLSSGGYGYGRVIKVIVRVLLWMKLLNVRSDNLLSLEEVRKAKAILDLKTRTRMINSVEWPIIGHIPFTDEELHAIKNEPYWITGYVPDDIIEIAEWVFSGKRGLPPDMGAPYQGYRPGLLPYKIKRIKSGR